MSSVPTPAIEKHAHLFSQLTKVNDPIESDILLNNILKSEYIISPEGIQKLVSVIIQTLKSNPYLMDPMIEFYLNLYSHQDDANNSLSYLRNKLLTLLLKGPQGSKTLLTCLLYMIKGCYEGGMFDVMDLYSLFLEFNSNNSTCLCYSQHILLFNIQARELLETSPDLAHELAKSVQRVITWMKKESYTFYQFYNCIDARNILSEDYFNLSDYLFKNTFFEGSLLSFIKSDDPDSLSGQTADENFDYNMTLTTTPYCLYFSVLQGKNTLLEFAAAYRAVKCFKFLLLNTPNRNDNVVNCAIAGGDLEIIRLCQQNNFKFQDTLKIAANFHKIDVFNWFLTSFGEYKDNELDDVLNKAAKEGNWDILVAAFENGIDPQRRIGEGTILSIGAVMNNEDLVDYALYLGCDPNFVGDSGSTPFLLACGSTNLTNVIKLGNLPQTNKQMRSDDGWDALIYAAIRGSDEIVQYIINNFSPNFTTKTHHINETALDCASHRTLSKAFEYLFPYYEDQLSDPLYFQSILQKLLKASGPLNNLQIACKSKFFSVDQMIGNKSIMEFAMINAFPDAIRYLISIGVDPNPVTSSSSPALLQYLNAIPIRNFECLLSIPQVNVNFGPHHKTLIQELQVCNETSLKMFKLILSRPDYIITNEDKQFIESYNHHTNSYKEEVKRIFQQYNNKELPPIIPTGDEDKVDSSCLLI